MIPKGCVKECPGCRHRELTIEQSLNQKYNFLTSKLLFWAKLIEPVVSVDNDLRWGYRAKTTLNARWDSGWQFGMISRDDLISIPNCPLHKPNVNRILQILRENLPSYHQFPLAFYIQTSAQVVLILKSKVVPSLEWLTEKIVEDIKLLGVEGLWIHLNPSAGKRLFEKTKWILLFGHPRSKDTNGLFYGPGAFQQLMPELFKKSIVEASSFLKPNETTAVVDLYCGTGTTMKHWNNNGADVIGVEVGAESIECAKLNVPTATIRRGACRQRIPQLKDWVNSKRGEQKLILIYINPPRTGIEIEVLDWIINHGKPERIAYLSCSAGTLSKNLITLTNNGYLVKRLIPFDFFPQTIHVECLALLEKN